MLQGGASVAVDQHQRGSGGEGGVGARKGLDEAYSVASGTRYIRYINNPTRITQTVDLP